MDILHVEYLVLLNITFSLEEVNMLLEMAQVHYDGDCRATVRKLMMPMKQVYEEQVTDPELADPHRYFTFRELDVMAKTMEMWEGATNPQLAIGLHIDLKKAMNKAEECKPQ